MIFIYKFIYRYRFNAKITQSIMASMLLQSKDKIICQQQCFKHTVNRPISSFTADNACETKSSLSACGRGWDYMITDVQLMCS